MSVSLFDAVPTGAIEVLTDVKGAPFFKRADLGRFLGLLTLKRHIKTLKLFHESYSAWGWVQPTPRSVKTIMMPSLLWMLLWR